MTKKVSIYDVAKYVNVSPATVSYVVNGVDKVSKKTKEKILKGIEELGYTPNQTAVSLSTGQSKLIAVFLPWENASIPFLQNPFYGEFIGFIEKEISDHNYDLVIQSLKDSSSFEAWAKSRAIDGVIMLGSMPQSIYKGIKELSIPAVLVDIYEKYSNEFSNVRINDAEGSYLATKYLIDKGHKGIGFVCGDIDHSIVDRSRFEGYKKALDEVNISDYYCFNTQATFDGGYSIAEEVTKNKNITAVVAAADIIAIGMIKKYNELGINIPNRLSIVGFDDIRDSVFIHPELTTIRQDIYEKSKYAVEIIFDQIKNKSKTKKNIVLEPVLVERETVKSLR